MIKYKLYCKECLNTFDSWFASSKEFEKIKKLNYLCCNKCNSSNIHKSLMAPNLLKTKKDKKIGLENDKKFVEVKKKIKEYQKFIKNNFEYVGNNFAYEARSIHYNVKKKQKGIYGSASRQELKELKDEGIDAQIVPWVEDKNN